MSIKVSNARLQAFKLNGNGDYLGLLNEILEEIFVPQTAFEPPPKVIDFNLEQKQGQTMASILSEVRSKVVAHAVNSRHSWSLAHMVPPPATVSVIADLLIGAMNMCAFIWEEAPIALALETEVIDWMKARVGYGERATGLLTSGGTMSNCLATYLALARSYAKQPRQYREAYCIIASDQSHFSIDKAAALTGLGDVSVVRIKTDNEGRLQPGQVYSAAERAQNNGKNPFLFICTAGTTNAGVMESADEFISAAHAFGAWCHIDAAHGGMMGYSHKSAAAVSGWHEADSVSVDPHKSLYVSYSVGALLLREEAFKEPLKFNSEYAIKDENMADAGAWHLDGSRRLEALKLWMTIKYFGSEAIADLVDHSVMLAEEFANQIRSNSDFVLITEPDTNIVCFRFVHPDLKDKELDRINLAIQKKLFITGGPLISTTQVGERIVLRVVLLNPMLEFHQLKDIIASIQKEAHRYKARNKINGRI